MIQNSERSCRVPAPILTGGAFTCAILLACAARAQGSFTNAIAVPSHHYVLSDTRNEVFVKSIVKRWRPYDDFVRFGGDASMFLRRFPEVATIHRPKNGAKVSVSLVNGDSFETVQRVSCELRVGEKGAGTRDVYAQFLGDSLTHGKYFASAVLDPTCVPKVHLVGLCKCAEGQYNEGRGGWTLSSYFTVPKRPDRSYHGFMHPKDGRYWGNRAFWVMAWRCTRGTQPKGFEPSYSCARFDDFVGRFDERTGVLLDPQPGDVQFDEAAKSFVRYDGASWKAVAEKDLDFGFDYGKYLRMWNLRAPDFLFVTLGTNDFGSDLNCDFAPFAQKIDALKASYLQSNPRGRFVLVLTITVYGSSRNKAGEFSEKKHAVWWSLRDWMIRTYDNREAEGYHLVDIGAAADDDNGFLVLDPKDAACLPFETYKGKDRLHVQYGNPHPYASYPAMSVAPAAFIQYWRARD